jgi:hypothetical protein
VGALTLEGRQGRAARVEDGQACGARDEEAGHRGRHRFFGADGATTRLIAGARGEGGGDRGGQGIMRVVRGALRGFTGGGGGVGVLHENGLHY